MYAIHLVCAFGFGCDTCLWHCEKCNIWCHTNYTKYAIPFISVFKLHSSFIYVTWRWFNWAQTQPHIAPKTEASRTPPQPVRFEAHLRLQFPFCHENCHITPVLCNPENLVCTANPLTSFVPKHHTPVGAGVKYKFIYLFCWIRIYCLSFLVYAMHENLWQEDSEKYGWQWIVQLVGVKLRVLCSRICAIDAKMERFEHTKQTGPGNETLYLYMEWFW